MNLGLFVLRVVVGGLFIGHGTQKLFGWFNGYGVEGTAGFMGKLGYRPPKQMAILAGAAETGGGVLLILGLFTPLAAAAIIGVMVNAMIAVHAPKGVWNQVLRVDVRVPRRGDGHHRRRDRLWPAERGGRRGRGLGRGAAPRGLRPTASRA
jgi:putative oxidoreductase